MKAKFKATLKNGAVIEDPFYFSNKVGKGILNDVFSNWIALLKIIYDTEIKEATYECNC
jgi:hypothetical protein